MLQAISRSIADTRPVFDTILGCCSNLFAGTQQTVLLFDDTQRQLVLAAHNGPAREVIEAYFPMPVGDNPFQHALREARTLRYDSVLHGADTPELLRDIVRAMDFGDCSQVFVPLRWEGRGIGTLIVVRAPPRPFAEDEIAMLASFADQAVIAIQNARLFNETKEALEQQTATAEVLQVISQSPDDVQPVFEAIAERAKALCNAKVSGVARYDGELVHLVAFHGVSPAADAAMHAIFPVPVTAGTITARAIRERAPVQTADILGDPSYAAKEAARLAGYRSNLAVPMLHDDRVIGSIAVCRAEAGLFPDSQVKLLQTFADQAVIAIENVRLFTETQDALQRQTATAEILKVIASSPNDVQPVFEVMVERAVKLCGAHVGRIYRYDGSLIRMVATHGIGADWLKRVPAVFPRPAGDDTIAGLVVHTRAPYFVADIEQPQSPPVPEISRQMIRALGTRSQVTVPMLRNGEPIGAITLGWLAPGAFDDSAGCAAADLCRPGGDRGRERAPVQRDQGGAGTRDRQRRGAARHRRLHGRCAAGVREHLRQHVAAAAGGRPGDRLARRRRPDPLARRLR